MQSTKGIQGSMKVGSSVYFLEIIDTKLIGLHICLIDYQFHFSYQYFRSNTNLCIAYQLW